MAKKQETEGVWGRVWHRFGDVAKKLGLAGEGDVEQALDHQKERKSLRRPHKKIGQILVEHGKMEQGHVKDVLKEQKKGKAAPKKAKKGKAAKGKKKAAKKVKKAKKRKR